jgi:UDP:flavonoid glycosyltransferase YjiC (YdhE family)
MRILLSARPADGHFNPLTGIATHLAAVGHDVRWYAGPEYAGRVNRLGMMAYPYVAATEVTGTNINVLFPERAKLKGPRLISFDAEKYFVANVAEQFQDIVAIRAEFPFDLFFCDGSLYVEQLVAQVLRIPVFATGMSAVMPTAESPPPFFGLSPARSVVDRVRHGVTRRLLVAGNKRALASYNHTLAAHGLRTMPPDAFPDGPMAHVTRVFIDGAPGLEFPGYEPPPNAEFVGPLAPARSSLPASAPLPAQVLDPVAPIVVVSQGTIDNTDPNKLVVPTIEALSKGSYVVVATTGGARTSELRRRYASPSVIIEDFLDYGDLLLRADAFVTSGGFGSTLAAIGAGVPLVGAGIREGKNDLNVRMAHNGLGVDLRTERPKPAAIRAAVDQVLHDATIRANVARVQAELASYDPFTTIEQAVAALSTRQSEHT